jgi:hypothetical protein
MFLFFCIIEQFEEKYTDECEVERWMRTLKFVTIHMSIAYVHEDQN